jgi:hypothetical protein
VKFLIDTSGHEIQRKWHDDFVCGQLLTPLTRYSDWGGFYAIDNGAFSGFPEKEFRALLERQKGARDRCKFVTCPDIVGNGRRTLELWEHRHEWLSGWPAALVLQNGVEDLTIPWADCAAVFIGGIDPWKESQACVDLVKTAKTLGIWVHVGRVNTYGRWKRFADLGADSCDGSGVARYDHMLSAIIRAETTPARGLFDGQSDPEPAAMCRAGD